MAAIHDTAYPRLKYNLTQKEIARVYTPVDEEMIWLKKRRFKGEQSLTCLVYLKCFQRLDYFPKSSDIPVLLINHIASFTRFDRDNHKRLPAVPKATHKRIKDAVRRYCSVTAFSLRHQGAWIKTFADDIARTKENLIDIINAMLEFLVKESIELPIETTNWTEIDKLFGPLSGHQKKVRDYKKRLVASMLCFGCNLGPSQTARSIKSLTRKQVAYLNLSHVREKDLIKATEKVINAYNEYDLPKFCGSGENASVDGTRFDMYEQNLLSEYHLR